MPNKRAVVEGESRFLVFAFYLHTWETLEGCQTSHLPHWAALIDVEGETATATATRVHSVTAGDGHRVAEIIKATTLLRDTADFTSMSRTVRRGHSLVYSLTALWQSHSHSHNYDYAHSYTGTCTGAASIPRLRALSDLGARHKHDRDEILSEASSQNAIWNFEFVYTRHKSISNRPKNL